MYIYRTLLFVQQNFVNEYRRNEIYTVAPCDPIQRLSRRTVNSM